MTPALPHGYWSRQRVHQAVLHRIRAGKSMGIADVLSDEARLYAAAFRCAGGWRRTLRDLGYDYRQFCRQRPKWSAEHVIQCILKRESTGRPLRATDVQRDDSKLRSAADRYFGTWSAALRASGIDPEAVSHARKWTPRRVLQQVRQLGAQGVALNCKAAMDADSGLVAAAYGFFGSWDNALRACGCDPALVRRRLPSWTRSTIIRTVQQRAAAGLPVCFGKMAPRSAVMAARHLFRSWDEVLSKAGALHLVSKPPHWSRRAVIERIGMYRQERRPLNETAIRQHDKALTTAARRYFGQWNRALRAAGLDPDTIRLHCPKWTSDATLRAIRKLAATGHSLRSKSIHPESLVAAGRRYFGSWPQAVAAAGAIGRPATSDITSKERPRGKGTRQRSEA